MAGENIQIYSVKKMHFVKLFPPHNDLIISLPM